MITGAHCDEIMSAQLMVHVSGPKLWFRWPVNDYNKQFVGPHWLTKSQLILDGSLMKALNVLQGLSVRVI